MPIFLLERSLKGRHLPPYYRISDETETAIKLDIVHRTNNRQRVTSYWFPKRDVRIDHGRVEIPEELWNERRSR